MGTIGHDCVPFGNGPSFLFRSKLQYLDINFHIGFHSEFFLFARANSMGANFRNIPNENQRFGYVLCNYDALVGGGGHNTIHADNARKSRWGVYLLDIYG